MSRSAADRIIPARGLTARLTVGATAAMTFLAVLCLAASLAALALAGQWSRALDGVATVEIADGDSAATARVLERLAATPGVERAVEVSAERQAELLAPWLGKDFPVEALSLPRLIEVEEGPGLDRSALRADLAAVAPGARYLTPDTWQSEIAQEARRAGWIALALVALMLGVTGAVVTLAVSTALASEAQTIATLRLVGAEDGFIRAIFVRRFVRRALVGAGLGWAAALALLLGAADMPAGAGVLLATLLPPLLSALTAWAATHVAARRLLVRSPYGDLA